MKKANDLLSQFDVTGLSEAGGRLVLSSVLLLAELNALFPEYNYYFIGRDMEYYFHIAELLSEDIKSKSVLLNVSRASMYDPLLREYCIEHGILRNKAILIDSGFAGSVIEHIKKEFSETDIPIALIRSENPNIIQFNAVQKGLGMLLDSSVIEKKRFVENGLEYLPHPYSKVTSYVRKNGHIEEVWNISEEYSVQFEKLMEELRTYFIDDERQQAFAELCDCYASCVDCLRPSYDAIELVLDFDSIIDGSNSNYYCTYELKVDKKRFRVPIGLDGFLMWLKRMSNSGNIKLFAYSRKNAALLDRVLECGRINNVALRDMGWKLVAPEFANERLGIIRFPSRDIKPDEKYHFQHDYSSILEYMENNRFCGYRRQETDVIDDNLSDPVVLGLFLDILSNKNNLDPYIFLDERRIGKLWDLFLHLDSKVS